MSASYSHERLGKRHGEMTLVTVFGGTGFLGHHVVEALAWEGRTVRVAVRHPDRAVIPGGPDRGRSHRWPAGQGRIRAAIDAFVGAGGRGGRWWVFSE